MGWLDPAWAHRVPIAITNPNAYGLSYYQHSFPIPKAALNGHAKSDFSDLRVTDSDGTSLIKFCLEGSDATNWYVKAKVPQNPPAGKTGYAYYANAAASSISDALGTVVSSNIPPLGATPSIVVDNTASIFNGPAAITVAANGNLVALYTNGSNNFGTAGSLLCRVSSNGGASWGAASTVISSSGGSSSLSMRVIKLTTLASGHIIAGVENDLTTNINNGKHFTLVSADNGSTWTVSASITPPAAFTSSNGYGGIIELTPGGDLWWPWVGVRVGDTKNSVFVMRCASGNNPLTPANWGLLGGTAVAATVFRDAGGSLTYTEADATVVAAGVVLFSAREDTSKRLRLSLTTDTGATWSAPSDLTDLAGATTGTGVSPQMLTLANGDVLCTWGERTKQSNGTFGTGASITTDRGTTWTALAMPIQVTGTPGVVDAAYCSTCQRPDGTLYGMVSIASSASVAVLYGFAFDEDWVCNAYNSYDDMEGASVGANWTLGANARQDTGFAHNGTKSLFLDNSAGTGGVNATAVRVLGAESGGYPVRIVSMSWWSWIDEDTNTAIYARLRDGAGGVGGAIRLYMEDFAASSPFKSMFFNGVADTDWTNPLTIPVSTWGKKKILVKHVSETVLTASYWYNDAFVGNNGANEATGTTNSFTNMQYQAGSSGGTNPIQFHVDDWSQEQYPGGEPTYVIGAEQSNTVSTLLLARRRRLAA